ncbi:MAG: hypothetical protein H8E72_07030 [Candidatus Marinimicrobia bacterium]|nr:hypothetical protein [Candidatus Neomarinimicrobiota bacterium]
MKKKIILLITLFIASTVLVGAEPLAKKSKTEDKADASKLNKVKPANKKQSTPNVVKPMKKKPQKPSEVQSQLELLRKKYEAEKMTINDDYKKNLKMLKMRKRDALDELKVEFTKKRAHLRKKY